MLTSYNVKDIEGQGMFPILEKIRKIENTKLQKVYNLCIGDPKYPYPLEAVEKARYYMLKETGYGDSQGLYELRQEIGCPENVIITPGANHAIYLALACICDRGDEVYMRHTYFPTYISACKSLGLKVVHTMSNNTKVIIINSPCNPTGKILSEDTIKSIDTLARMNNAWIIKDNVYEKIIYNGYKLLDIPYEKQIIINSISKSHCLPGFRVGWAIACEEVIEKMKLMIETTVSCVPQFLQHGAIEALKDKNYVEEMVSEMEYRRMIMGEELKEIDGIDYEKPQGAFYYWINTLRKNIKGKDLFEKLLEKNVAICPGNIFGEGETHIRISFCAEVKDIQNGMKIIKEVLNE